MIGVWWSSASCPTKEVFVNSYRRIYRSRIFFWSSFFVLGYSRLKRFNCLGSLILRAVVTLAHYIGLTFHFLCVLRKTIRARCLKFSHTDSCYRQLITENRMVVLGASVGYCLKDKKTFGSLLVDPNYSHQSF